MLKRLLIAAAILAGIAAPVQAAGTITGISMSQQLDTQGNPLNGGKLYLIQAGTTATPQNCYQDSGLTLAWPNPITLDSAGRIPQIFCADGSIKIRLTNSAGITQLVADNLLVVGPSGGGGGGSTVDPTTILATGDFKQVYNTGVLTGFVRCNGRSIGSATSGATERANADTSALFVFLWNADSNLAVSGGRGASAAADFAANKALALPDCRGRSFASMTDMGASASTIWDTATFTAGGNGATLGATVGAATRAIAQANLPNVNFALSGTLSTLSTATGVPLNAVPYGAINGSGGLFGIIGPSSGTVAINAGQVVSNGALSGSSCPSCVASSGGSGTVLQSASPFIFVTTYIKL